MNAVEASKSAMPVVKTLINSSFRRMETSRKRTMHPLIGRFAPFFKPRARPNRTGSIWQARPIGAGRSNPGAGFAIVRLNRLLDPHVTIDGREQILGADRFCDIAVHASRQTF